MRVITGKNSIVAKMKWYNYNMMYGHDCPRASYLIMDLLQLQCQSRELDDSKEMLDQLQRQLEIKVCENMIIYYELHNYSHVCVCAFRNLPWSNVDQLYLLYLMSSQVPKVLCRIQNSR